MRPGAGPKVTLSRVEVSSMESKTQNKIIQNVKP